MSHSEKHILHKTIEKLSLEIQEVRDRQEEVRAAKQVFLYCVTNPKY